MFKIRKLRNRAMATKAYKKPSSRAVCVIISKRMRSFHAAAPGSRPGERSGEFDSDQSLVVVTSTTSPMLSKQA